jgi:hypothetical protein
MWKAFSAAKAKLEFLSLAYTIAAPNSILPITDRILQIFSAKLTLLKKDS